ncbi:Bifunctional bis(5'-adenosyl)-triphosphatase/adenylylsulfatase FHIT-like protein [Drosera capensis]
MNWTEGYCSPTGDSTSSTQLLHPSSLGGARRCLGGDGIRNPYLDIRQRLRLRSIATSHVSDRWVFYGDRWVRTSTSLGRTRSMRMKCSIPPISPMLWSICAHLFLREVKRFLDLNPSETADLWLTAQKVGRQLEQYHKASSLTFAIQDGAQAGQTVPHVHVHILPQKVGDFDQNDEIYDAIDVKENELAEKLDLDKERKDRSLEEMGEEVEEYRRLFA